MAARRHQIMRDVNFMPRRRSFSIRPHRIRSQNALLIIDFLGADVIACSVWRHGRAQTCRAHGAGDEAAVGWVHQVRAWKTLLVHTNAWLRSDRVGGRRTDSHAAMSRMVSGQYNYWIQQPHITNPYTTNSRQNLETTNEFESPDFSMFKYLSNPI